MQLKHCRQAQERSSGAAPGSVNTVLTPARLMGGLGGDDGTKGGAAPGADARSSGYLQVFVAVMIVVIAARASRRNRPDARGPRQSGDRAPLSSAGAVSGGQWIALAPVAILVPDARRNWGQASPSVEQIRHAGQPEAAPRPVPVGTPKLFPSDESGIEFVSRCA